jgi:hypothetical protein
MTNSQAHRLGVTDERDRVLTLLRAAIKRLVASKGYGWLTELDRLEAEVWKGTQEIPFTEEVEDEVTTAAVVG